MNILTGPRAIATSAFPVRMTVTVAMAMTVGATLVVSAEQTAKEVEHGEVQRC